MLVVCKHKESVFPNMLAFNALRDLTATLYVHFQIVINYHVPANLFPIHENTDANLQIL